MINKIPFMDRYQARDEKEYYVYIPGTTHYKNDEHGNPRYVYDCYYLDNSFNKFIKDFDSNYVNIVAAEFIKSGRDVIVGACDPDEPNSSRKGIWERPTEDEVNNYKRILESQKEKQVKKLA